MSPKRILVATDFSIGGDEALLQAIDLARRTGGMLELLNVLEPGVEIAPLGINHLNDGGLISYIDRELSRRAHLAARAGVECHQEMVEGSAVATEIVKHANYVGADVIVLGTHGRGALARVPLGSVAERVVRLASCPVLTIQSSRKAA